MDRHVEVVGLEGVCHLPEGAEGVAPGRLLEAKCLLRLAALLPEGRSVSVRIHVTETRAERSLRYFCRKKLFI